MNHIGLHELLFLLWPLWELAQKLRIKNYCRRLFCCGRKRYMGFRHTLRSFLREKDVFSQQLHLGHPLRTHHMYLEIPALWTAMARMEGCIGGLAWAVPFQGRQKGAGQKRKWGSACCELRTQPGDDHHGPNQQCRQGNPVNEDLFKEENETTWI